MQGDMGGAACVVADCWAVAGLQLPLNIRALIPLCENMPGCASIIPTLTSESLHSVVFCTYHGALAIVLSVLFCTTWILFRFHFEDCRRTDTPYSIVEATIVFYMALLLCKLRLLFLPSNGLNIWAMALPLLAAWSACAFQVIFLSNITLGYFMSPTLGMSVPL